MLLLASNAWTPLLHPFFEGAIVGMRGQMFATEPCPHRLIPAPVYADFGFKEVEMKLSTRPEKRVGSDELWDRAEAALRRRRCADRGRTDRSGASR